MISVIVAQTQEIEGELPEPIEVSILYGAQFAYRNKGDRLPRYMVVQPRARYSSRVLVELHHIFFIDKDVHRLECEQIAAESFHLLVQHQREIIRETFMAYVLGFSVGWMIYMSLLILLYLY